MSSWSNCCAAAKFRADESTGGWRNRIHSGAGGLGGVAAVTSRGRCWGWEGSQPVCVEPERQRENRRGAGGAGKAEG